MFTPEVERYTYYSNKIASLSKIYSNYLINKVNTNPFIVILNITPIFIINFLVNFSDIVILINKPYDFSKDPLFDLKGDYKDFERYATLIRGLYWNAVSVNEKIKAGNKITDVDLIYTHKETPIVKQKVDVSKAVNRYNTKKLPVLIIDATNIDSTAYIPVSSFQTYEMLKIGKPASNELVYKDFSQPEISDMIEDLDIEEFEQKKKINDLILTKTISTTIYKNNSKKKSSNKMKNRNIRKSVNCGSHYANKEPRKELELKKQQSEIFEEPLDSGSDSGDSDFLD